MLRPESSRARRLCLVELAATLRVERDLEEQLLVVLFPVRAIHRQSRSVDRRVASGRMGEENVVFGRGKEDLEDSRRSCGEEEKKGDGTSSLSADESI
jgi:hypothetical protein